MKLIILTILFPCVFGQWECPPLPEDLPGCDYPDLSCEGTSGPDGCPVPPNCVYADIADICSAKYCPTVCPDFINTKHCMGGVDAEGCQLAEICHPVDPNTNCPNINECPVVCGPNQIRCYGVSDPNDPNGCKVSDSCIDMDYTAVCQNFCPPDPCPTNEWPCAPPLDVNGCVMPYVCSTSGVCPEVIM